MAFDGSGNWRPVLPDPPAIGRHYGTLRYGDDPPTGDLGNNGDMYVTESTGDVYRKVAGSWNIISQGVAGGSGMVGDVDPQGVASATPGTTYWDKTNKRLWLKSTGTGVVGWEQVV